MQPSEGDEFPEDPTMDMEFATSGPEFYDDNMEFGTQVEAPELVAQEGEETQALRRSSRQRKPTWKAIESAGWKWNVRLEVE
jgi:hypothetical protein